MGIKISSLPNNALPYTGSEKIPLVQNGQTRAGTLSSLTNYLSGNFAVKNANNNFTAGQTITGSITAATFVLSGGNDPISYSMKRFNGDGSFGITDTPSQSMSANYAITFGKDSCSGMGIGSISIITDIVAVGNSAGSSIGNAGAATDIVAVGNYAGNSIGSSSGIANYVVAVGNLAGINVGAELGTATNIVAIGQNACDSGGYNGTATDIVAIGNSAGNSAGTAGTATNIIAIGFETNRNVGVGSEGYAADIISMGQSSGIYIGAERAVESSGNAVNIITLGKNTGSYMGSGNDTYPTGGNATEIIAIGTDAGYSAGGGGADYDGSINNGIMIGNQAGYLAGQGGSYGSPLSGSGDVNDLIAIGREAGYQSGYKTTSNNNIFIGLSSGYNKQGSRNTFVGDLTNTSPTSATSLSGCIAIGYGAVPTARNTIAIGSASTPLSVVPGGTIGSSLSGLKIMINGRYFTIPLLA